MNEFICLSIITEIKLRTTPPPPPPARHHGTRRAASTAEKDQTRHGEDNYNSLKQQPIRETLDSAPPSPLPSPPPPARQVILTFHTLTSQVTPTTPRFPWPDSLTLLVRLLLLLFNIIIVIVIILRYYSHCNEYYDIITTLLRP